MISIKRKIQFASSIFILAIILVSLNSCYKDSFEELNPGYYQSCDTLSVITYTDHIQPLMQEQCVGCHSGTGPTGSIDLSTYENVKSVAESGLLYSSVIWDGNAIQMPEGSSMKISDCYIVQIRKWIEGNYAP